MPIGALLGGASLLSGLFGASSARSAARSQERSADQAVQEQRRQFDTTRADFAPWMEAGRGALGRLQDPNANFMASPDYEFRRNEGERGIGQSFAPRGGAFSGNALRALSQFNSNMASGEFGNWWNRQSSLAGLGQTAAGSVGQFGANAAGNIGNALMARGEAGAAGRLGAANSIGGAVNSGLNNFLLMRGGYFGSGGGGGGGAGLMGWNYPNGGFGGGIRNG
jgi:hypothetical protein